MSFILHPGWQRYSPHLKIERKPKTEIAFVGPPKIRAAAENLRMPCISCGRLISPIRAKNGKYLYLPFCPPDIRRACSETPLLDEEYERIGRLLQPIP